MFYGLQLIILGILAAPALLLDKKPDAKELLAKIQPYQGWAGAILCITGIIGVIQAIMGIGLLTTHPIWWITWIACTAVQTLLGFILGYGLINQYVLGKNEEAKAKGEAMLAKLTPIQTKLGLAGIVLGIWCIIANIMFL